MCAHPGTYWRIPEKGHNKNAVWCNKIPRSERNCTWQVGSVTGINYNVVENKTFFTSELLYSSIIDPPKNATIIEKSDSGASNIYWHTKYQLVLKYVKDTYNWPTVQLPNNYTMSEIHTGHIPLSSILITHKTKAHIFDGLHNT